MHRGNVYIQVGLYVTDVQWREEIDKVYDNENTMKIQLPQDKMMSPSPVLTQLYHPTTQDHHKVRDKPARVFLD